MRILMRELGDVKSPDLLDFVKLAGVFPFAKVDVALSLLKFLYLSLTKSSDVSFPKFLVGNLNWLHVGFNFLRPPTEEFEGDRKQEYEDYNDKPFNKTEAGHAKLTLFAKPLLVVSIVFTITQCGVIKETQKEKLLGLC